MKDQYKTKALAKINLCLDVVRKREDGRHDLVSIMQTISLYDHLEIKKVNKEGYLKIVNNLYHLPNDERNIVYKAVRAIISKFPDKINTGIFINLKKKIPVSAGLGGGSSDCASTLKALNIMFDLGMNNGDIANIGETLGADVPFFTVGGTQMAEGIGEILTPLTPLPRCYFVLLRPPLIISTADVFGKFDLAKVTQRPDVEKINFHIEKNDLEQICKCFVNVLETVTVTEYPIINQLKEELMENGALGALMSGSGPTVFGCFKTKYNAINAMNTIRKKYPTLRECFVVDSFKNFG